MTPGARAYLTRRDLDPGRCEIIGSDYLRSGAIPPADAYVLGSILHNHPDDQARTILANLRTASPAARIILAEIILPGSPVTHAGFDLDIRRMALGGQERTRREWDTLLATAGRRITDVRRSTSSPLSVIEARPSGR